MTGTLTTAAHMTGEEGLMSFLRQNMEDLASYGRTGKVPEDVFNEVVNGVLKSIRGLVNSARVELLERREGAAAVAGHETIGLRIIVDSEAIAAAFGAAKGELDRFH